MKRARDNWVKLPSAWINRQGLEPFRWAKHEGSDNTAAVMLLLVISHHVERENGWAALTYDEMAAFTGLSRAKVSSGLFLLRERRLIEASASDRGHYRLIGYEDKSGWAQVPARALYQDERIVAFDGFYLRRRAELDALKLYLLFAARRNNGSNMAIIGYEKIEEYTAIPRNAIRTAQSLLAAWGLIHVEHVATRTNEHGFVSGYRLAHLHPRQQMGTSLRIDPATLAIEGVDGRDDG